MNLNSFLISFVLICLAGCRLGPPYEPPAPVIPEDWKTEYDGCEPNPCVSYWWELFEDDTLNALELQAIENNPNLFAALQRVVEARAIAKGVSANLYPQINLQPSYSDIGELFKVNLPSNVAIPGGTALGKPFRVHLFQYTLPFDMSYEVDLWGKLRGQAESAIYNFQAQEDHYLSALLTLTTDVATNYFMLQTLDAQIELLKQTIEVRKKALNLNTSRFNNGLVTYSDVSNASLQLSNAEADYYDSVRQRNLLENVIATLVGVPSSCFHLVSHPLSGDPPAIPPGTPADVISQRPDVAEAERDMAAQHALIGPAYASFLPSLSLTGALGYLSPDFKDFLTWKSRFWAIGANIGQSIFDGGRNVANLELAYARFNETTGLYQQTVLTAFQEVEDALNNIELRDKQYNSLKISVKSSRTSTQLSTNRYLKGLANYIEIVINQQQELVAELSLVNVSGQRYVATIQLIKALGGSWQ